MDNVVQFAPRTKPVEATVESTPPTDNGGGSGCVAPEVMEPAAQPVQIPAALIQALAFYAVQGVDGGETARNALAGIGIKTLQGDFPGKGALILPAA